jgi:DNA-directed RNA polymerase subunit beta
LIKISKIQKNSFKNLLKKELYEEIKEIIHTKHGKVEIKIEDRIIKYKKPTYSILECIENFQTYHIEIYLPITIKYKNKELCKNKKIILGKIPLMTEKGTFIIKGRNRIVINQLIRSPGIYFEKEKKEKSFICTIIPNTGSWITIKIEKEGIIYSNIEGINNKIPIFILLQAIGLTKKKILCSTNNIEIIKMLLKNINKSTINTKKALDNINKIYEEENINKKNSKKELEIKETKKIRNFIYSKIMNSSKYNLNEIGRLRINTKLYKKENWKKDKALKPEDILGALIYLIKVKLELENEDDIDNLENKRIRNIGELLKNKIKSISYEIKEKIKLELNQSKETKVLVIKIKELINKKLITENLENFFATNPLSQIIDETNSLSEITQKRKLKSFGTKSTDKQKTKPKLREIKPSQYSRLCPIETAEGKNAGLVLAFAQEIKINRYGFIESPYYKIIKKKILKEKGIFFISAKKEKQLTLAPSDLFINKENKKTLIKKNKEFREGKIKNINFINKSTNQIFSSGTGLIPFIEHNDAIRSLMGSNMQRQAVPLIKKETAIVQTGLEKIIGKSTEKIKICKESGKIKFISQKKIKILKRNEKNIVKINNKSKNEKIKEKLKKIYNFRNKKYKIKNYCLKKNQKSNQNSEISNTKIIIKNQWVEKNQILADSKSTLKGKLTIGKNILIGYMSWEGYNFEDAIIISEKLVEKNKFTSKHIKKYQTILLEDETKIEKTTNILPNLKLKNIKILNKKGIIKIGSIIKKESILVGKIEKNKKNFLNTELLNYILKKERNKIISLETPPDIIGTIIDIKSFRKNRNHSITIYIAEKRKLKIGDKLSGRHGNKGIISAILPIEDMPYIQDGTNLDILLNPLGIPSRMNVGQIFECLLGLAGKNLIEKYKIKPFDEMNRKEISKKMIYKKLYEARKKTGKMWLFDLNNPGKIKTFNGKTGLKFNQTITCGYAYILKLMHLVEDKVHARSNGPCSSISKQPLRGKSKKGGQRFGEMEVWAIESFGATYILKQLFTRKSDDLTNKSNLLSELIKSKFLNKNQLSESLKILIIELQCLGIEINIQNKNRIIFI